jgi:outer membrane protein TolC
MALNGFNATYFFNSASAAYHITGALTAPLLNRKEITREYWLQASRKKEAFLQYQKIVFIGVGEVSTYYNRTLAYQRMSDFKQQEVSELKLAIDIANDLFLTGFANYLEVVTVRRNVLESEILLTEVRKGFFHANIDLYKALGGGWE